LVNNPPDKCFVFSLEMFRERSLKRAQGPIRERKAEARGKVRQSEYERLQ